MTELSPIQKQQLANLMQQILPNQDVSGWTDATGLLGDIPEFDSLALAQLLAGLSSNLRLEIADDQLNLEDFTNWGCFQAFVARLLAA